MKHSATDSGTPSRERPDCASEEGAVERISIEGVEVILKTCGHCGSVPTEMDAARCLKETRVRFKERVCAICGEAMRISRIILHHVEVGGSKGAQWMLDEVVVEKSTTYRVWGGRRLMWFHEDCLRRATPFGSWGEPDRDKLIGPFRYRWAVSNENEGGGE